MSEDDKAIITRKISSPHVGTSRWPLAVLRCQPVVQHSITWSFEYRTAPSYYQLRAACCTSGKDYYFTIQDIERHVDSFHTYSTASFHVKHCRFRHLVKITSVCCSLHDFGRIRYDDEIKTPFFSKFFHGSLSLYASQAPENRTEKV